MRQYSKGHPIKKYIQFPISIMTQDNSSLTLRFLAEPTDVNFGGKVHGGAVMKWIDQTGYACATAWAGKYCVTVYVGGIQFIRPIHIGDIVEVNADVICTGKTSIHINIEVRASSTLKPEYKLTTKCTIVFVALDQDGKPTDVPKWIPQSEEQKKLETYALESTEKRKQLEEELDKILEE